VGDQAVYDFSMDKHVENPQEYFLGWRHVLSVDPAGATKLGYTLWAEHPGTGVWYCVRADYVQGLQAPDDIVMAVEKPVAGCNIVRRISDTAPWYVGAAYKLGYKYQVVECKAHRKMDLIKNLQTSISSGKLKVCSWCPDLVDEFSSCQWSEEKEGAIIASSTYHLLDSCQYFVDAMPKREVVADPRSHDKAILEAHYTRLKEEKQRTKGQQVRKTWNPISVQRSSRHW
jgi:hypothetical protein